MENVFTSVCRVTMYINEGRDSSWPTSRPTMRSRLILSLPLLLFPPFSRDQKWFSTFLHRSCPTLCLSPWVRECSSDICVFVCVCVRENRHLEGHDKVCEVKLGLQVQLDRHVLHTWKTKTTPTTQEINNEILLRVLKLSTHRRRFSFSHTLSNVYRLFLHMFMSRLSGRAHIQI